MVDFKKLRKDRKALPIDPQELFYSLVRKPDLEYLRDVQKEVLDAWYAKRTEQQDTIIKMNTGAGKTLVGLLMLQSSLNENVGPALYLCPTNQLVDQVVTHAKDYGISVLTEDGDFPPDFLNGKKILVSTFQTLFNGMSRFGVVGGRHQPVQLGSVLIDDAHTCLSKAREQVSIVFPRTHKAYAQLLTLFQPVLEEQSKPAMADIECGAPGASMAVPFWGWMNANSDVARIISSHRDDVKFTWPLLQEDLALCHCIVSSRDILITPHIVPLQRVPSFGKAKRRFFLSATLVDDSVLVRDFAVSQPAVLKPIRPKITGDIGERMILMPSLIDSSLKREQTMPLVKQIVAAGYNTVVLTQSNKAAEYWRGAGAAFPQSEDALRNMLEKLRTSDGNFVVLANRYDGIDLPNRACRLLVMDEAPIAGLAYEQYQINSRPGSKQLTATLAQRIEQGLGRGVRSGSDYCGILLLGSELARFVAVGENQAFFSPETRRQIEIGIELTSAIREEGKNFLEGIRSTLDSCLKQDKEWRQHHRDELSSITAAPPVKPEPVELASAERESVRSFRANNAASASEQLQTFVSGPKGPTDDADRGWHLQFAATLMHPEDPGRAQEIQKKAHELNPNLLRPLGGTSYRRLQARRGIQAQRVHTWVQHRIEHKLIPVEVESILNSLTFGARAHAFEQALKDLGTFLGFETQRPDWEFGVGPDVLWDTAGEHYLIIEAKNEVDVDRETIAKSEASQLASSALWFKSEYGQKPNTPVLVHPSRVTATDAFLPDDAQILTPDRLVKLHGKVRQFAVALAAKPPMAWTVDQVGGLLVAHSLTPDPFRSNFLIGPAKSV